jgi:hypothetical protein
VIDGSFRTVWLELYRHQADLLDEVQDLGPGAAARVHRDLEKARAVLKDLGVNVGEGVPDDKSVTN